MQAICNGDYKFAPAEYWAGVSETARSFVMACLTVDPTNRPTAADLQNHPWIRGEGVQGVQDPEKPSGAAVNLLPNVKAAFDAKKTCEQTTLSLRGPMADDSPSRCYGHDGGQEATGQFRGACWYGTDPRAARATAERSRCIQGRGRAGE